MSDDLKRVLGVLPKLTPDDRKKLRKALEFLDGSGGSAPPKEAASDDWLAAGIVSELRRRGLGYQAALNGRSLQLLSSTYSKEHVALMEDLRAKLMKSKIAVAEDARASHTELLVLGRVVARALADYLQPVAPLGLKFLLNNVSKIPEAVEASYPGYLEAGMLRMLVGRKDLGTKS